MSDYLTRTAGLGYLKSSLLLFALVLLVLGVWYFVLGSVSVSRITNRKAECFYWTAILFSNTLGTALGDSLADTTRLGYEGGAFVFAGAVAGRGCLLLEQHLAHDFVLGGFHSHMAARGDVGGFAHQTGRARWFQPKPDFFVGRDRRLYRRRHFLHLPGSGRPSRSGWNDVVMGKDDDGAETDAIRNRVFGLTNSPRYVGSAAGRRGNFPSIQIAW